MSGHLGVGLAAASYPTEPVDRRGSGRIRHEEKITVYVSAEELLALEQARLDPACAVRHGSRPWADRPRGDRSDAC